MGRVVYDSCSVNKRSYDKQVVSGQSIFGTNQIIINPNLTL